MDDRLALRSLIKRYIWTFLEFTFTYQLADHGERSELVFLLGRTTMALENLFVLSACWNASRYDTACTGFDFCVSTFHKLQKLPPMSSKLKVHWICLLLSVTESKISMTH